MIGPFSLPATSFEENGIASFLMSTLNEIGDVSTIGLFCTKMDLTSDWYLRKVEVLKHSETPDGDHWSDKDTITKLAKFECHTWFSPAMNTHSISQVFHHSTERLERSICVDYLSRCKQLFLQKHMLTSWTCSYGLRSFNKIQRLAFLYTIWFVLILLSTLYLDRFGLQEIQGSVHIFHIGVIRLNKVTIWFAFVVAVGTYAAAALLSTTARLVNKKRQDAYSQNFRPLHIDVVRSQVVTNNDEDISKRASNNRPDKGNSNGLSNSVTEDAEQFTIGQDKPGITEEPSSVTPNSEDKDDHLNRPKEHAAKNATPLQADYLVDNNSQPVGKNFGNGLTIHKQITEPRSLDIDSVALDIEDEDLDSANNYMNATDSFEINNSNYKYTGYEGDEDSNRLFECPNNEFVYKEGRLVECSSIPMDITSSNSDLITARENPSYLGSDIEGEDNEETPNIKRPSNGIMKNTTQQMKNGRLGNAKKVNFAMPQDAEQVAEKYQVHFHEDEEDASLSNGHVNASGSCETTESGLHTEDHGQQENGQAVITTQVQFLNRETLPSTKENPFTACFHRFASYAFWLLHILLVASTAVFSLMCSKDWSSDHVYHWMSMSTMAMAVACCLIDTARVMLYVLAITIKERHSLAAKEKQTSWQQHWDRVHTFKRAESERDEFFNHEFPEERWRIVKDHYRFKGKVIDFFIFALFVFVLLTLTKWIMSDRSFRFWHSLKRLFNDVETLSTIQQDGASVSACSEDFICLGDAIPSYNTLLNLLVVTDVTDVNLRRG